MNRQDIAAKRSPSVFARQIGRQGKYAPASRTLPHKRAADQEWREIVTPSGRRMKVPVR